MPRQVGWSRTARKRDTDTATDRLGTQERPLWIKRGTTGLIGPNKAGSTETVDYVVADLADLKSCREPDSGALAGVLAARGVRVVSHGDWRAIHAVEAARGQAQRRPRQPLTSREDPPAVLGR